MTPSSGLNKVPQRKWLLATTSLAGCFGCHMSLLDIDERILQLVEVGEFNKSPFDDIKPMKDAWW